MKEKQVQVVFLYTGRNGSPENLCDLLTVTELICGNVRPTLLIFGPVFDLFSCLFKLIVIPLKGLDPLAAALEIFSDSSL